MRWKVWLGEEPNDFNPMWYYLANIVAEIRRIFAKNPNNVKLEEALLKFEFEKQPKPDSKPVEPGELPESVRRRTEESKREWMTALGMIGNKGKVITKRDKNVRPNTKPPKN